MTHNMTKVVKRRKKIMELRLHGLTYNSIGKIMGITKQRVQQLIKKYLNGGNYDSASDYQKISHR